MQRVKRILLIFLVTAGTLFSFQLILALTSLPFHLWYRLSLAEAGINRPPDYIIILGGGGMPSESGLMRCWYGAEAAARFPGASVIIALPGDTTDQRSSVYGMKKELVIRGIPPEKIRFESSGTNTREQALLVAGEIRSRILIITSPEHLYRAVKSFRKAGFMLVDGLPAFEAAIESDISLRGRSLGGRKWVPDLGESITVRYQFWTQLNYEALIAREYLAITYYWLKGWI